MIQFADEATIRVQSGKGGNGCASFRREKYIPNGGPNGGDGGRGGDIIFCVKKNLRTLAHLRFHPVLKAQNGSDGHSWGKYGKDGEDKVIPVPPGTTIRDKETGEIIIDFPTDSEEQQFTFLKGGNGGWGNIHFKSSTNQAPRRANKGEPGEVRELRVELSVMADVGLVGFPNAGKSSLLDLFTNARPKIAPYPFTTKIPNLGVLHVDTDTDLIIADIPGIIEGASEGAGLGIRFLKHISRTACLLFMIDCSDDNYLEAYDLLLKELEGFGGDLTKKPRIVLCNKIDVEGAEERAQEVVEKLTARDSEIKVIPVSVMARKNMNEARLAIVSLVEKMNAAKDAEKKDVEGKPAKSDFMAGRSVDDSMEVQFPGSEG
ncbi:MAG: GTPase ObgE [Spirochaetales bacterium]|nr:GTPase ObgE [Spirochaetales bacterium]